MTEGNQKEIRSEEQVAAIEERWARWKRPLILTLSFFAVLGLYVFVYPVFFWFIESWDLPDWFYDGMEKTVYPLIWMDENFKLYTLYIKWLGNVLDP